MDATYDIVEDVLQTRGQGADPAVTNLEMVDRTDRKHLRAGSAEEDLIRDIEFGAVDIAFLNRQAEFLTAETDEGGTRDALEDATRQARGDHDAVSDKKEAGRRTLGHLAGLVQEDRLVKAIALGLDEGEPAVLVIGDALDPG